MANRDYYDVLGVSKTDNDEEIRRAFRKRAMEFHPDRNKEAGAEEKFKEINEAYQVLSDSKKRAQYDSFGVIHPQMRRLYITVYRISRALPWALIRGGR